jgi:predicted RNase H-like nuclease
VWDESEFGVANRRCRQRTGGGLTRQAWALREKLREANDCWSRLPMYEVHPEVSFRQMAGAVLSLPKTTWYGQTMRRGLLAAHGIVVPDELGEAGLAAPDDVLDAAAAACSAPDRDRPGGQPPGSARAVGRRRQHRDLGVAAGG